MRGNRSRWNLEITVLATSMQLIGRLGDSASHGHVLIETHVVWKWWLKQVIQYEAIIYTVQTCDSPPIICGS